MKKLKIEDEVIVIAGSSKGERGTISELVGDDRAIVRGVNMVKRHTKPNPNANKPGGIIRSEASIHISNIAIFNADTGLADRIGFKINDDGVKVRIFKSNGQEIV